jgi:DNA-binding YbaB/EbfC family protein
MGTGFSKKKKQARMLQEQLTKMQSHMEDLEVTGEAGNGLVSITVTGEHEMKSIKINPSCVDSEDIEGLEDLIKAAWKDAMNKMKAQQMEGMPSMPPGMPNLGAFGL